MTRDSIIFYRSFYEAIKGLDPEDFKKCACAILDYGLDGKEPDSTGIENAIFQLTKPQIDANAKRYENGCKGGRPKQNQNKTEQKPKLNQNEPKRQNAEPNENDNDNDNENDNDNDKKNPLNNTYIHDDARASIKYTMYTAKGVSE